MNELIQFYEEMGISSDVYAYGDKVIEKLKDRCAEIDKVAEYNQTYGTNESYTSSNDKRH